jgi:hypothetical protein
VAGCWTGSGCLPGGGAPGAGWFGLVWFEGAAVLFGGAMAVGGVAAQAEREGDVWVHRLAERGQPSDAEADGQGDGDEVCVGPSVVGGCGLDGGAAGEADVVVGKEGDDEVLEDLGGDIRHWQAVGSAWLWFRTCGHMPMGLLALD